MPKTSFSLVVGLFTSLCLFQIACSSSSPANPAPTATTPDAPGAGSQAPAVVAPIVDAGTGDTGTTVVVPFPAPHPDPRQLTKLKGPVLAHPHVVPLFYGDDADRAQTEAILKQLPGSPYWAGLKEYGVLDITIEPSVVIAANAPTSYSLGDIETTVGDLFPRATDPAPAPDGTQIYAVFFPTQTNVVQVDGSQFCDAGGAYHLETFEQPTAFSYAVIPHCGPAFDDYMLATTHELMEASTDPNPYSNPAWAGTDKNHVGFRGEIGDLCDYNGRFDGAGFTMFGSRVERMFSNERSLKGLDPCTPNDDKTQFFGSAPLPPDDVTVEDAILGSVPGKGVTLPVGKTKTVSLALFSNGDMPEWKVSASVMNQYGSAPATDVKATLDKKSGKNGDIINLTLKRDGAPGEGTSGDVVFIYSYTSELFYLDTIYVGQ